MRPRVRSVSWGANDARPDGSRETILDRAGWEKAGVAHVCILMATRNGAAHLREQLDSILAQDHADWSLWVSDDGSTDGTMALLEAFRAAHPARVRLVEGPQRGSAANFLSLLGRADPWPTGAFAAFADQDDVWLSHRLSRALSLMAADGAGEPRVYASRTLHVGPDLSPQGPSRLPARPLSFANALVQNVLAGNTLLLDPDAAALLRRTVPAALAGRGVAHHDWWTYLVAAGAGARILVDPEPGLLYRQHAGNHVGAHVGPRAGLARAAALWQGTWRDWTDRNLAAIEAAQDAFAPEALALARRFGGLRGQTLGLRRLVALAGTSIRRQTAAQDVVLALMLALGRI